MEQHKKLADIINYISCKLMDDGHQPHTIAGIMAGCALSIYKSSLNEEDFNSMIDEISLRRNDIGPFIRSEQVEIEDVIMSARSKYLH